MKQTQNNKKQQKKLRKSSIFSLNTLALGGLLLFPNSSNAQTFQLQQTYFNPNPSLNSLYGTSVSLDSGNNFVVGAPSDTSDTNNATSTVFYYQNGILTQTYTNPNPTIPFAQSGRFGVTTAINNNNTVVGAWGNNSSNLDAGQGFLFHTTNTTPQQTYNSLNPTSAGQFGISSAISGNTVVFGASNENGGNGNAYVGNIANNTLSQLTVPTGNSGQFGFSVAANGSNILVGAPFANNQTFTGEAYLFNGNTLITTFPGSFAGSEFGYAVDINNSVVAIGARNQNNSASGNGAVYLFNLNGNPIGNPIVNPEINTLNGYFGSSVSLFNNEVLIGAPGNNNNTGAAYRYRISDQALLQTFLNPSPNSGDNFGFSVDSNGQYILIGASNDDTNADNGGAAYLYNLTQLDQQQVPEASNLIGIIVAGGALLGLRQKK